MAADAAPPEAPIVRDGLPVPRRYLAIAALSIGNMLAVIDGGIANVALPTIARELSITANDAVLVVTVYQLVLVMTLLPFSALGDRIGHRRLYQGGQALFAVASLLFLVIDSLPGLLVARACQALGAGAMLAVTAALLRASYPARHLGRGLGFNAVVIATGSVLAPTLGGAILSVAPWQWVFVAAVPFALVSLVLGRTALPRPRQYSEHFDIKASALSALTFGLLIVGLEGLSHGQPLSLSLSELACGALAGWFFVRGQLKVPRPLMPLELLRKPLFALSFLAAFGAHVAQMCVMVSMPFRLQHGHGFTPAESGVLLSPWPFTMMIVAPAAGFLSDRVPAGLLGGIGMMLAAMGLAALSFLPDHPSAFDIGWPMALCGAGFGLFFSPNVRLIIGSAQKERVAAAGSMVGTVRLFGQAIGASTVAAILAIGLGDGGLATTVAFCLVVIAAAFSLARLAQQPLRGAAPPIPHEF